MPSAKAIYSNIAYQVQQELNLQEFIDSSKLTYMVAERFLKNCSISRENLATVYEFAKIRLFRLKNFAYFHEQDLTQPFTFDEKKALSLLHQALVINFVKSSIAEMIFIQDHFNEFVMLTIFLARGNLHAALAEAQKIPSRGNARHSAFKKIADFIFFQEDSGGAFFQLLPESEVKQSLCFAVEELQTSLEQIQRTDYLEKLMQESAQTDIEEAIKFICRILERLSFAELLSLQNILENSETEHLIPQEMGRMISNDESEYSYEQLLFECIIDTIDKKKFDDVKLCLSGFDPEAAQNIASTMRPTSEFAIEGFELISRYYLEIGKLQKAYAAIELIPDEKKKSELIKKCAKEELLQST